MYFVYLTDILIYMGKKVQKEIGVWQWKGMEYISYFAIFLTPLIIGNSLLYSFSTSKSLFLTAITLIMLVLYLWGSLSKKETKLNITPIHIALFVFLFALTISSIFGIDPINSFFGWRYAVSLVHIYILSIFALLIGFLVRRNSDFLPKILLFSFLSSIIVTIIFYTGLSINISDGSTIGNSSYLGEYLFFNVLFGIGLFVYYKKYWKKILMALGALFIIFSPIFINKNIFLGTINIAEVIKNPILLFGIANGATLGLGISFITVVLLLLISSRKKLLKIIGGILLVFFIFSIYYTYHELVNKNSMIHKVYVEQKSGNRFIAWDIAKKSFKDNPILGNGLNNYPYSYEKYFTTDFYKTGYFLERFNQPHNIFWEFVSNTGILGLTSFLFLLIVTFISLFKKDKEDILVIESKSSNKEVINNSKLNILKLILASILVGYFIQNLFVFDTISTYLMLFIIIGISIGGSNYSWEIKIFEKFEIIKKFFTAFAIACSFIFIILFVFLPLSEARIWNKMFLSIDNIIEYSNSKKDIQKISVYGGLFDSTYVGEKLFDKLQNNLSRVNKDNKKDFLSMLYYITGIIEKDTQKQPNYADSYFMIGNYLNLYMTAEMKDVDDLKNREDSYNKEIWEKAYYSLTKSIELNPNNPKAYLALVKTYMIKDDLDNAKKAVSASMMIAPEYKENYVFARALLSKPDTNFQKYVDDMESRWILNPIISQP